ncbi:DUF475 domain-containing protein [uncultured Nevskia sp.]|uniref:DUF475 domain-containing protein n=1 Tax=uncultured Nevskia sp. TaxID=228950 RepID=UPI0025D69843|nr:DUF475 domain-containing protein [uncultured Nevskia sp.]
MRDFRISFLVSAICLIAAGVWGYQTEIGLATALWLTIVLAVLEVSLSFDNAVVNAGVLKDMNTYWRRLFLTVGILIAVFGMRLVFPIVIVAVATGLGVWPVVDMALNNPDEYSAVLGNAYPAIAAFGGMFLLLVFLNFLFNDKRQLHWLGSSERWLASLGRIDSVAVLVSLVTLFGTRWFLPDVVEDDVLVAGLAGVILYIGVDALGSLFGEPGDAVASGVKRSGLAAFMYLEVLDASFSFDGVIGAFAITRDVVIIMLGLAIGAMFVRSMTVYLVNKGTLDEYVFLEHGAHYAIGMLAVIMIAGTVVHVPEVVTGLLGIAFIGASVWSSVRYNKRQRALDSRP